VRLPPTPDAGGHPRARVIEALLTVGCKISKGYDEDEIVIEDEDGNIEVHPLPDPVHYKMVQYLIQKFGPERFIPALKPKSPN
jgi:hypothetical protein